MAPILPILGSLAKSFTINIFLTVMFTILIGKCRKKVNQVKTAWHKRSIKKKFDKSGLVVIE